MKLAKILYVNHALIVRRDDGAVEVVHDAADGVGIMTVRGIFVVYDNLLADSVAIGPTALCKLPADHHLVRRAEHLVPVARQQTIVEELEEVGRRNEQLGVDLLTINGKPHAIARY